MINAHTIIHAQLRAPGCPVIIVGTHLDAVSAQVAKELEDEAKIKYSNTSIYPKVTVLYVHVYTGTPTCKCSYTSSE